MAYVSLYRKYRPQTFDEVVGQRHVTQTLVNAIAEDRLHHAYLFTGPRGTGKTSTARILAKAINCEQGPTTSPCNQCDACVAITTGASIDVIELDMASHGGVDDARELRERALFAPARARTKVYILDEVHMASTAAFNALLKLIEEPPAHVVFAMATTDPQKVLPTIMSRVQRLDLRRINAADLSAHVRDLAGREGATVDDDAVAAIVRTGDGSVRDTLSVLEQALSYAGASGDGGGTVTAELVIQLLGHTPAERTFAAVERLAAGDLAGLLSLVQGLLDDGHDLRRFGFDLLHHLRDLLVLQVAPDRPDLVDATAERREQLAGQARTLPRDTLLRAVELLSTTVAEQRQGPARLPLEVALARLVVSSAAVADGHADAASDGATTHGAVVTTEPEPTASGGADDPPPGTTSGVAAGDAAPDRAATVEAPATATATAATASAIPAPATATDTSATDASAPATASGTSVDEPAADELTMISRRWVAILDLVKDESRRIHAVYEPAQPVAVARGVLTLRYPARYKSFHAANARKAAFADVLQAAVARACGITLRVDAVVDGDDQRRPLPPVVTPADARHPDRAGDSAEEAAVRETEAVDQPVEIDLAATEALLASELGAELVDEQPAPDRR